MGTIDDPKQVAIGLCIALPDAIEKLVQWLPHCVRCGEVATHGGPPYASRCAKHARVRDRECYYGRLEALLGLGDMAQRVVQAWVEQDREKG